MSAESNKDLVRRWFEEVWNQGRISAIAEMMHPSGSASGFPEPESVLQGPAEFARAREQFKDAFPDIRLTVDDIIAEGDKVAVLWTATMTHMGHGLGYPASMKKVSVPGASFVRCRDGQLFDGRNHMDFTKVQLQLQGKA